MTVMLAALVLKYRPNAADKTDDRALGIFLILLNALGATTLVCFLIFKFVVPKTEEERKTRSSTLIHVFTGRKKTVKRSPSGNEVPQIEEGARIELGTIHKKSDGANEVKGSENPMLLSLRLGNLAKKVTSEAASAGGVPKGLLRDAIGVPLPPSDWEGYNDPKYKAQKEVKRKEDETIKMYRDAGKL